MDKIVTTVTLDPAGRKMAGSSGANIGAWLAAPTDPETGERLPSPLVRTVKGHVSNILSKLQIGDRTQAAVLAWKRGVARKDGS